MLYHVSQGSECKVITEDLIKALGDVITTENTEEYFQERVVNTQRVKRPCYSLLSYDLKSHREQHTGLVRVVKQELKFLNLNYSKLEICVKFSE